ncbi:hypothetical protein DdX_03462 [Ditylenchus destructor]|uniref:Uncharacterized protein n=1 Tax=Ditylenchus destructor TaxID=166010 RepID=A0AAD4R4T8_9BILA|nr:hypothetical protein DdX_03462 [Ditylenchus destructor]
MLRAGNPAALVTCLAGSWFSLIYSAALFLFVLLLPFQPNQSILGSSLPFDGYIYTPGQDPCTHNNKGNPWGWIGNGKATLAQWPSCSSHCALPRLPPKLAPISSLPLSPKDESNRCLISQS